MNTNSNSEQELTHLQEQSTRAVIEDRSLPADLVLAGQNDQDERPALFIP